EVMDLVKEGKRDPKKVSIILQGIIENRRDVFPPFFEFRLPPVTSNGMTDKDWIAQGEIDFSDWAKDIMSKTEFNKSVTNNITYHPVLIKGDEFSGKERIIKNIRAEAKRRGYITPPPELAPLLRQAISDEDIKALGLTWLAVMHEPIIGFGGSPSLFGLFWSDVGRWLDAYFGDPDHYWSRDDGFIFLAPQVSKKEVFEYVKYS
ncbi:MAG: hypothetical protein WD607_05415, partial [Candidatus Paceibacterota bacterium]